MTLHHFIFACTSFRQFMPLLDAFRSCFKSSGRSLVKLTLIGIIGRLFMFSSSCFWCGETRIGRFLVASWRPPYFLIELPRIFLFGSENIRKHEYSPVSANIRIRQNSPEYTNSKTNTVNSNVDRLFWSLRDHRECFNRWISDVATRADQPGWFPRTKLKSGLRDTCHWRLLASFNDYAKSILIKFLRFRPTLPIPKP